MKESEGLTEAHQGRGGRARGGSACQLAPARIAGHASCWESTTWVRTCGALWRPRARKCPSRSPRSRSTPSHPIVKYLESVPDEEQFKEFAQLLYDQAALAEGGQLANPADYVQRLNRLLVRLAGASKLP